MTENEQASTMCAHLYKIGQFWDDLIDRDKELTDGDIHSAMWAVLFDLNENPFFRKLMPELLPVIKNATIQWFAANKLEEKKEHIEKSYMLRAGFYNIVAHVVMLCNGAKYDFSEVYKLYGEKLEDLKKEIECQSQ